MWCERSAMWVLVLKCIIFGTVWACVGEQVRLSILYLHITASLVKHVSIVLGGWRLESGYLTSVSHLEGPRLCRLLLMLAPQGPTMEIHFCWTCTSPSVSTLPPNTHSWHPKGTKWDEWKFRKSFKNKGGTWMWYSRFFLFCIFFWHFLYIETNQNYKQN